MVSVSLPLVERFLTLSRQANAYRTFNVYIIKVKGKAKIPDYIQLRDEHFVLIAYFRADRPLKDLHRYGLEGQEVPLAAVISELEFGKLRKLEL